MCCPFFRLDFLQLMTGDTWKNSLRELLKIPKGRKMSRVQTVYEGFLKMLSLSRRLIEQLHFYNALCVLRKMYCKYVLCPKTMKSGTILVF